MKKFLLGAAVGSVVGAGATIYYLVRYVSETPSAMAGLKHTIQLNVEEALYGSPIYKDARPSIREQYSAAHFHATTMGKHSR